VYPEIPGEVFVVTYRIKTNGEFKLMVNSN